MGASRINKEDTNEKWTTVEVKQHEQDGSTLGKLIRVSCTENHKILETITKSPMKSPKIGCRSFKDVVGGDRCSGNQARILKPFPVPRTKGGNVVLSLM